MGQKYYYGVEHCYLINAARISNLTLECTGKLLGLDRLDLTLPHLDEGEPACMALLTGLAGHTAGAGAGHDCKALARQPGFQNTANNVQCASLDNTGTDRLRATHADVDDALERETESVRCSTVKGSSRVVRSLHRGRYMGMFGGGCWRKETIKEGSRLWGRWLSAKVAEEADETLEPAVHCEDFTDAGGGGGKICEMSERVEER